MLLVIVSVVVCVGAAADLQYTARGARLLTARVPPAAAASVSPPADASPSDAPTGSSMPAVRSSPSEAASDDVKPDPLHDTWTVDVVVAGDGLGGVAAAVQAARRGHDVVLLSPLGYVGGQATAAAVSSMDEASGSARDLLRASGLYREFVAAVRAHYAGADLAMCYFRANDTFCPEPNVVHDVLEQMLDDAGVAVVHAEPGSAIVDGRDRVTGLLDDSGRRYEGLVVDATEFADVTASAGIDTEIGDAGVGGCVQDLTHAVVMAWYPQGPPQDLVVPADALQAVRGEVGATLVDAWLAEFRTLVVGDGITEFDRWADLSFPLAPSLADAYRGMPDPRPSVATAIDAPDVTVSGVNLANDVPVTRAAVHGGAARVDTFRTATLKSYLYLWYERWELGRDHWSVASHLGFDALQRRVWVDAVPDAIERHMPPDYYVREARRLRSAIPLTGEQIAHAGPHELADSVVLGGSRSDADHGECDVTDSTLKTTHGSYEVPLSVFVPEQVDGLLVGVARNGAVDRAVASSLRMHPSEMLGGQAVGMLVALAIETDTATRDVPAAAVRDALMEVGALVDVPKGADAASLDRR